MAWTQAFPSAAVVEERAERALRWPIGAASPLWAVFGAAASAGVAWWWLTRWTRAVNVEALAGYTAEQVKRTIEIAADTELRVEEAVVAADQSAAELEAPLAAEAAAEEVAQELSLEHAADDLTRMSGVGPKLSAALAERGVTSFAQIARWTADDLAEVDAALNLRGRAVREAWVAQAKRLANGVGEG
jgi:predicted flap endonuclease-1-like 5' DNA nuclease